MGRPRHILVVDDDENVRDVIVAILQEHQYRVGTASSGLVMRDFLETSDPVDCVVLDALMPGEGFSPAVYLKERGVPVVMISGSPAAMEDATDNRQQFLAKPFRSEELYSAINTAFAGGRRGTATPDADPDTGRSDQTGVTDKEDRVELQTEPAVLAAITSGDAAAREQAIRERAYAIWEEEGRPQGRDLDHWFRAVTEFDSDEKPDAHPPKSA